jgi:predicted CXXCH cytochrome family protein
VGQFIADTSYGTHLVNPDVEGQDCDRCHDPHQGDNWQFLTDTIPASYRNANVCAVCHVHESGDELPSGDGCIACHDTGHTSHPIDVLTDLPQDRTWDPSASPPDFSGTTLWDSDGTAIIPEGDAYIKCKTCHVPHGAVLDSALNSMPYSDPDNTHSPICENCH